MLGADTRLVLTVTGLVEVVESRAVRRFINLLTLFFLDECTQDVRLCLRQTRCIVALIKLSLHAFPSFSAPRTGTVPIGPVCWNHTSDRQANLRHRLDSFPEDLA